MAELLALPQLAYWAGASTLYLGFSAVLGIALRRARASRSFGSCLLAAGYGLFLFAPATIFILQRADWPPGLQTADLAIGAIAILTGAWQPACTPSRMWRDQFGRRYFAVTMAFAALWGLSLGLSAWSLSPIVVGVSALAAGAAAVLSTPRSF